MATAGALEYQELMSEGKNLGLQRCTSLKDLPSRRKQRANDREHVAEKLQRRPPKFNQFSQNGVFGRDKMQESACKTWPSYGPASTSFTMKQRGADFDYRWRRRELRGLGSTQRLFTNCSVNHRSLVETPDRIVRRPFEFRRAYPSWFERQRRLACR